MVMFFDESSFTILRPSLLIVVLPVVTELRPLMSFDNLISKPSLLEFVTTPILPSDKFVTSAPPLRFIVSPSLTLTFLSEEVSSPTNSRVPMPTVSLMLLIESDTSFNSPSVAARSLTIFILSQVILLRPAINFPLSFLLEVVVTS